MQQALLVVEQVHPHFDIVEVGTPLIIEEGLRPVAEIRKRWSDKEVLADLKIMDAGELEASSGFSRGAHIVIILALADDATVKGAVRAANKHGGRLMADLINTPASRIAERARELAALGVHMLCVHTAYDLAGSGVDPLAELATVRSAVDVPIAIAGGMKLDTVGPAAAAGADILVVGGAIVAQPDPRKAAQAIQRALGEQESR